MILEFKVKNYKSFKKEQLLSFEATSEDKLDEYYCHQISPNIKILKLGMIFGANASGKSNLLDALEFIRRVSLTPLERGKRTGFIPYLFDKNTKNQPGKFDLTFFIDWQKFHYSVLIDNERIYNELLYHYPKGQPALIFSRKNGKKNNSKINLKIGSLVKLTESDKKAIILNTLENMTVISSMKKINIDFPELTNVYNWFTNYPLKLITPRTDLFGWTSSKVEKDENCKNTILELLNTADINISDVTIEEKIIPINSEMKKKLLESPIPNQMKQEIIDKNNLKIKKILFQHTIPGDRIQNNYFLNVELESRGTRRFYSLGGPLTEIINQNKFLMIDELENSLHSELVSHFIEIFLANSSKSQLIFTTHNLNIISESDSIRKDAVWFTEKNQSGSTKLFSLAEFKGLNRIRNYLKAYKAGKFGALPNLGSIFLRDK